MSADLKLTQQLQQTVQDLEIELITTIEHGDVIEQQLDALNRQLMLEIKQRQIAEARLEAVLAVVNQQKEDLEVLVDTLAVHGDEVDVRWMSRYADIEQLVRKDGLTKIGNRRHFDDYLAHMLLDCQHTSTPLALVFCDIDYFKRYNDSCGHWEGDTVLIKVAQALQSVCQRPVDRPMRYGGEEFALVLPDTDKAGAVQVAESLQATLLAMNLPHKHSPFGRITLSIGVVSLLPSNIETAHSLVVRADALLYRAKELGRNRIETA
ncbi:MAG: GGDEF domain-containing protein [Sulfuriferula sp.]|nr:GGDEF domain-containing protein [Sulfuriferula sp.]